MDVAGAQFQQLAGADGLVGSLEVEANWIPPTALVGVETVTASHYHLAKRSLDVSVAILALLVLSPLLLFVAAVVRTTSGGPVLFRQSRVGYKGRTFTVLKFRSMCADAEDRLQQEGLYESYVSGGFKLQPMHESRVTRVGYFLRRTSLDEFPQLFNVLRGDMSLVGPRPVVPQELANYGDLAHCYLNVRPGLTGMWQVNGRSHVGFPQRAHLDRDYFHGRSLRLDLGILVRTPRAVIRGDGAY